MKVSLRAVLFLVFAFSSVVAFCQSHEFAVTVGGHFPSNNSYSTKNSFAFGAQYSKRVFHVPMASLYLDLPLIVTPNSTFKGAGVCITTPCVFPGRYSAVFFTPGLKLKLAPGFPVSPYVVAGGGFAHFNAGKNPFPSTSDTANKGVFEFGGGVDMKIAPFFSLRAEARDFYANTPSFVGIEDKQHNVVAQTGLVFRF